MYLVHSMMCVVRVLDVDELRYSTFLDMNSSLFLFLYM